MNVARGPSEAVRSKRILACTKYHECQPVRSVSLIDLLGIWRKTLLVFLWFHQIGENPSI